MRSVYATKRDREEEKTSSRRKKTRENIALSCNEYTLNMLSIINKYELGMMMTTMMKLVLKIIIKLKYHFIVFIVDS